MTSTILTVVGLIAVMYFMVLRPENKKKKQAEEMRDGLSVGDEIITAGGLVGKICAIKEDTVVFETSEDRVRLEVLKTAINSTGKA